MKKTLLWIGALVVGAVIGLLGLSWLNEVMNFVATAYTRLFQLFCYFLTLSLMSGIGAPVAILGIILPIYTIIDMVETAENVWSDSCVASMVDKDLS